MVVGRSAHSPAPPVAATLADEWIPRQVRKGDVWRLVTPIFLHGGWIHLLFNMYMFFQFGALIETRKGTWRQSLGFVLSLMPVSQQL